MKKGLKKWLLRIAATCMLIAALLVIIVLNPLLTYGSRSVQDKFSIYHSKPLDPALGLRLSAAADLLKSSALYDSSLHLDICLNDGSLYPGLMRKLRGPAFGWGFYNKVVLMGEASYAADYVELNGYRWNLTQLLAHEMTHCYQFNALGLRHSNPLARIPEWKWEGYPEYVARQEPEQKNLALNIERLQQTEATDNNGWIRFNDSAGTVITYYRYWLLVQYCMDVRHMSYRQLLADTASMQTQDARMMHWYQARPEQD